MTPNAAPDSVLTQLVTPIATEVVIRLAVSWRKLKPSDRPIVGSLYRDLRIDATSRPETDLWGDYVLLDKFENGPEGYHYFFYGKPKTDTEMRTPYDERDGDGQHYDWPKVVHGVAFAYDWSNPVRVPKRDGTTVTEPRLIGRPVITESTFAHCKTKLKFYLGPRPFNSPPRPQPSPGLVTWWESDREVSLTALHPDLELPSKGETWNIGWTTGDVQVTSLPSARRTFPATPLDDWQPFVVGIKAGQYPDNGLFYMIEEWIYPPPQPERISL